MSASAHGEGGLDRAPARAQSWATTRQQLEAREPQVPDADRSNERASRVSGMRIGPRAVVGSTIGGRFRLDGILGRGGMGVVFDAHDLALDRPVVLKVLSPELARDELAMARLAREARVCARVVHPGVVAILDLGTLETGEPFLVMERLFGHDLGECLDAWGALPIEQALPILEQVADALEHLHGAGIVHRDVKPSNVFMLDGPTMRVKVIDFGLALADDESFTRLTQHGIIVGTAEYLAPELAVGGHPTARSDTYALACVAYEMLAGAPPFQGNPIEVLAEKRMHAAPSLEDLGVASREVASVIARAMSVRPDERPLPAELTRALRDAVALRATMAAAAVAAPAVVHRLDEGPVTLPMDRRPALGGLVAILVLTVVLAAAVLHSLW